MINTLPQYPLKLKISQDITSWHGTLPHLKYLFYISQLNTWFPMNGQPYQLKIKSSNNDITKTLMNHLAVSLPLSCMNSQPHRNFEFAQEKITEEHKQKFYDVFTTSLNLLLTDQEQRILKDNFDKMVLSDGFESSPELHEKICVAAHKKAGVAVNKKFSELSVDEHLDVGESFDKITRKAFDESGFKTRKISLLGEYYKCSRWSVTFDQYLQLPDKDILENENIELEVFNHDYEIFCQLNNFTSEDALKTYILSSVNTKNELYKEGIRNVLYLAAAAADDIHMDALLNDPETLEIAKENNGEWLLTRVIENKIDIQPFGGADRNIDKTLKIMSDKGVLDPNREKIQSLIESYRAFFTVEDVVTPPSYTSSLFTFVASHYIKQNEAADVATNEQDDVRQSFCSIV